MLVSVTISNHLSFQWQKKQHDMILSLVVYMILAEVTEQCSFYDAYNRYKTFQFIYLTVLNKRFINQSLAIFVIINSRQNIITIFEMTII